jgi:hypothetical protein
MVVEDAINPTVGVEVTLMVKFFGVLRQLPLLPVTVYIVVEEGVNVLVLPEPLGNHVYVVAPVTDATTEVPLHMVVLVIDVATVGVEVTLIVMVLVELQLPLNPLTV